MKFRLAVPAVAVALAVGLGSLALAPAALASSAHPQASSVSAEAPAFDASGTWGITQSNGLHPTVVVSQDALGNLTGTASVGSTTGTFEQGFVDGTYIEFVIDWNNGTRGRYIGELGSDRRLSGVGTDLAHPSSQTTWVSNRTF
ncbi:hypothetical protein GCM10010252_31080 [Streptomyces aureoverticillatus]|nr:hypothetical protein GCM10010252_31080 [Streptomyces aureoverticillatus]